jgi:SpoVK/Ycf46/Vps4 family AAA+-type ATPase
MQYDEYVLKSEGFSGAEVVACCQDAVLLAIEQAREYVSNSDMLSAIAKIKPQITKEMLQFYESFHQKHSL